MGDLLVELASNPQARRLIRTMGLPIPMPQRLRRAGGPWRERFLEDQWVVVGGQLAQLGPMLAATLAGAGANAAVVRREHLDPFRGPGEAVGRPPTLMRGEAPRDVRPRALVFDATGVATPAALRGLYDFFHPWVRALDRSGRVVVIGGAPVAGAAPEREAAAAALEGFVRSLAKELGRYGTTANLVTVEAGAEARLPPVLRWLLSERSAFVSGQPLRVTGSVSGGAEAPLTRPLDGRVALVTGAARGIGEATARALAREGAYVVCLDRPGDEERAAAVARDIQGSPLLADVSDLEAPARIAAQLRDAHGGVDVVVHNAGITRDKTLARMSRDQWDRTLDVNLAAIVRITGELVDSGTMRDHGHIVCLSSVGGIAGNMGQTNYAASKAGVIGYVRALATRLASRGIAVSAVAPGLIETRMTAAMPVAIREAARRLSALGQGGQPEDVAEAVTFLSSPGARGLSGSVLRVCGGAFVGA